MEVDEVGVAWTASEVPPPWRARALIICPAATAAAAEALGKVK